MLAIVCDAFAREEGGDTKRYRLGDEVEVSEVELAEEGRRRFPRIVLKRLNEEGGEGEEDLDLMDATSDAVLAQMESQRFRDDVGRPLVGARAAAVRGDALSRAEQFFGIEQEGY